MKLYWFGKSNTNTPNITIGGGDDVAPLIAFQWTTTLPTREGWYWAFWHHPKNDTPHIVFINNDLKFHDSLPYDDEGIWRPVSEYLTGYPVSWLGPLPVPNPPKP